MKRITRKPWFGRKYIGWGLRPTSPEGWLVTLIFLILFVLDLVYLRGNLSSVVLALLLVATFIVVALLTGDKPGSVLWERKEKRPFLISVYIVIAAVVIFGVYQIHTLKVAHSSFENYYNFRGCSQLLVKTDTYGICRLSSGQVIRLVEFQNKWYLNGDLPYPGINFL